MYVQIIIEKHMRVRLYDDDDDDDDEDEDDIMIVCWFENRKVLAWRLH
jgi:hypothetical protein